ncbi:NusG domain II-containing protein [Clostridium sp. DL1XJH146]
MKKTDVLILVGLLIVSLVFLGFNKYKSNDIKENKKEIYAEIYIGQELYKKVTLEDDYEETINIETYEGINVIEIHDGGVEIIESDCFDHICENTGFITEVGEMIVCLPHAVVVEIKGDEETKIDAISN